MTNAVEKDVVMRQPVERVWAALTTSDAIAQWGYPNTFEAEVGREFTLSPPPNPQADFDGTVHCKVLECEPMKVLAFTWEGGPVVGTEARFELAGNEEGTTSVRFRHTGFDLSQPWGEGALRGAEFGWNMMLEKIENVAGAMD